MDGERLSYKNGYENYVQEKWLARNRGGPRRRLFMEVNRYVCMFLDMDVVGTYQSKYLIS